MSEFSKFADAFTPAEVAQKVKTLGVAKANMSLFPLLILSMMAGAFIAFGAMYYTLVMTDPSAAYGASKLLGGIAFSLGFILVVIAGGELFTGNNLIVMAWANKRITLLCLLKNWGLVYLGNAVGALVMVYLVFVSGFLEGHHHAIGATALKLGLAKVDLTTTEAFVRGVFCNALVCLASWMVYASRTVMDKVIAVVFPISAFVAMGFEHCIANIFMIPVALVASLNPETVAATGLGVDALQNLTISGFLSNLIPVTLGNIFGGTIMVGMSLYVIYLYDHNAKTHK
ncbi:MAG: formate/nitrite transporter family protein [Gammaproteobacteria bacterium]|nr:formate/nitrite transporter family protein [Gammaproteobacteria bacterium]